MASYSPPTPPHPVPTEPSVAKLTDTPTSRRCRCCPRRRDRNRRSTPGQKTCWCSGWRRRSTSCRTSWTSSTTFTRSRFNAASWNWPREPHGWLVSGAKTEEPHCHPCKVTLLPSRSVKTHISLAQEANRKAQNSSLPDLLCSRPAVPFMRAPPG